jgi:hypothetical protein
MKIVKRTRWLAFFAMVFLNVSWSLEDKASTDNRSQKLYEQWVASSERESRYDQVVNNPAYLALQQVPDADLWFLKGTDHNGDWVFLLSRAELGKRNTQRTFDALRARLLYGNWSQREHAIWILSAFRRLECVPLLVEVLKRDSNRQVRASAVSALAEYKDNRAEPALLEVLKGDDLALAAARTLGMMNSNAAFDSVVKLLDRIYDDPEREGVLEAIRAYRRKAVVPLLIAEYEELSKRDDGWGKRLAHGVEITLVEYARLTAEMLGPPPDTIEQWREWWAQAEPLLSDDLKLKDQPEKLKMYQVEEFIISPEEIEFIALVDAGIYRIGDPIRLSLAMENRSKSPQSIILPKIAGRQLLWPMQYGINLSRNGIQILDLEPSSFYLGSYAGPPPFETLKPGEVYRDAVCLQYWLQGKIDVPLSEGEYRLKVVFDPSQFPGIKAGNSQALHRWDSRETLFTIKGEAREDPEEIIRVAAEKTGLKWLESDLISPRNERRERAWLAIYEYGDSRLRAYLEKIETKHLESRFYRLRPENLLPYEHQYQRPRESN